MKPLIAALLGLLSTASQAQQLEEISRFLKNIDANPARAEGAEFEFQAYVKGIEVVPTADGKIGLVELANDNLNGAIMNWSKTKLYCGMPTREAAKLERRAKVNVKGEVLEILADRQLVARCDVSLAPTPATLPKAPPTNAATSPARTAPTESRQDRSEQRQPSHCSPAEQVIFTCSTGKKLISVCVVAGSLQYRFGPPENVELSWPETPSQNQFVTQGRFAIAGGDGNYMRFSRGNTDYVVYSGSTRSQGGVVVEQRGKAIANVGCKQPETSELGGPLAKTISADAKGFALP